MVLACKFLIVLLYEEDVVYNSFEVFEPRHDNSPSINHKHPKSIQCTSCTLYIYMYFTYMSQRPNIKKLKMKEKDH